MDCFIRKIVLISVLAVFGRSQAIPPVWEPTGPVGADVLGVVTASANPSNITIVCTNPEQTCQTTNGGTNWTRKGNNITYSLSKMAAFDQNHISCINFLQGAVTSDGGATWTVKTLPSYAYALAVHPTNSQITYAAGIEFAGSQYSPAFISSTDGGQTWNATISPLRYDYLAVYDLAVSPSDPQKMYIAGYKRTTAGLSGALLRSVDGGANWEDISAKVDSTLNASFLAVEVDPQDSQKLYLSGSNFYYSSNGGTSWTKNSSVEGGMLISVDSANTSRLYMASTDTFYYSVDKGLNWTRKTAVFDNSIPRSIEIAPSNRSRIRVATNRGVYVSADYGKTWSAATGDLRLFGVSSIALSRNDPSLQVVMRDGDQPFVSTDAGAHWARGGSFERSEDVASLAAGNSLLALLGLDVQNKASLFQSVDRGASWMKVNESLTSGGGLAISPENPSVVFAVGSSSGGLSVIKSLDGGSSWSAPVVVAAGGGVLQDVVVSLINSSYVYVAGYEYGTTASAAVYLSTNKGQSWTKTASSPAAKEVTSILLEPLTSSQLFAGTDNGLFYSTNSGQSWTAKSFTESIIALTFGRTPNILYAATKSKGVYISEDSGGSFSPFNTGLIDLNASSLVFDSVHNRLLLGTKQAGVWMMQTSNTAVFRSWRQYR